MRITRINSWKLWLGSRPSERYAVVIHMRLSDEEYKQYNEGKFNLLASLCPSGEGEKK